MADWEQVLDDLVRTRHRALVGHAYLLCGDMRDAEDLVQEALTRTFSRGRRAKDFRLAESYVRTAITNVFLDGARKGKRWQGVRHLLTDPNTDHVPAVAEQIDVQRALGQLPPRQRACIVLRHFQDLTVPEISRQLSLSEGAIKRYLHDAHATLARILGPIESHTDVLRMTPRGGTK